MVVTLCMMYVRSYISYNTPNYIIIRILWQKMLGVICTRHMLEIACQSVDMHSKTDTSTMQCKDHLIN